MAVGCATKPKLLSTNASTAWTALTDTGGDARVVVTNFGTKPLDVRAGVHLARAMKVVAAPPEAKVVTAEFGGKLKYGSSGVWFDAIWTNCNVKRWYGVVRKGDKSKQWSCT